MKYNPTFIFSISNQNLYYPEWVVLTLSIAIEDK